MQSRNIIAKISVIFVCVIILTSYFGNYSLIGIIRNVDNNNILDFFSISNNDVQNEADNLNPPEISESVSESSNNLVLYLPMNEGIGHKVKDQSGNNYIGAIYGANWTKGISGSALAFDGVDDCVEILNTDILESQNSLTISAWVKVQSSSSLRYFVMTNGFGLFQSGTDIGLAISVPSTNNAKGEVTLNQWEFITGTFNGTDIEIYVNGELKSTTNWPGTMASGSRNLVFGNFSATYWKGEIDEVRIWNRALNAEEIASVMTDIKYVVHGPISITSDDDLNASFPGKGTRNDPILIENYSIIPQNDVPSLYIRDTTFYVRITHNLLNGSMLARQGILLENVENCEIVNNTVCNNIQNGIDLANSQNNTIINNTVFSNHGWSGISLDSSHNNTLINNTAYNNDNGHGIELSSSSENNSVSNNTAYGNYWAGISLYAYSTNNTISHNTLFSNDWTGIRIANGTRNNLIENRAYNNSLGIVVEDSSNNTIINNSIHDNELDGISFSNSDNNTLRNNTVRNNRYGFLLFDSKNTSIENNSLTNNGFYWGGPTIESYKQKTVANNTVNGKPFIYWEGKEGGVVPQGAGQIFLFNCTNVIIADTTLSNSTIGVLNAHCSHLIIRNNTLHDSRWGIFARHTNGSTITNNTGYNNRGDIQLWLADDNIVNNNTVGNNSLYGILLDTSKNTTISYNTIFKTNSGGIHLWGAENNTIAQNIIFNNVKDGIMIHESSKENFIKYNDFLGNNVGKPQASDNGTNNIFKDNYWSDWTGTGMYPIDGTKGNQDSSPLKNPYHLSAPVITAPTSTTLADKVTIQWTVSSDSFGHSITYTVYYSKDGGKSWIALASGLTVLTYTWDVTSLYHGTKVLLKIQSTDNIGFSSFSVLDTSFSIDNPGLISSSPTTPPLTTPPPPTTSKSTTTEPTASTSKSKTTTTITPGFTTLLLLATLIPLLLRRKLRQSL